MADSQYQPWESVLKWHHCCSAVQRGREVRGLLWESGEDKTSASGDALTSAHCSTSPDEPLPARQTLCSAHCVCVWGIMHVCAYWSTAPYSSDMLHFCTFKMNQHKNGLFEQWTTPFKQTKHTIRVFFKGNDRTSVTQNGWKVSTFYRILFSSVNNYKKVFHFRISLLPVHVTNISLVSVERRFPSNPTKCQHWFGRNLKGGQSSKKHLMWAIALVNKTGWVCVWWVKKRHHNISLFVTT